MLEGEPRAREMQVVKEASFRLEMGGTVGLMEKAVMGGGGGRGMCKVSGGWWEGGVGCAVATHSR